MKEVSVYRIEYRIGDRQWLAFVAAFNQKEATDQLSRMLKKDIVILTIGKETRLDVISDELRDYIIGSAYGTPVSEPKKEEPKKKGLRKKEEMPM